MQGGWGGVFLWIWQRENPLNSTHYIPDNFLHPLERDVVVVSLGPEKEGTHWTVYTLPSKRFLTSSKRGWGGGTTWGWNWWNHSTVHIIFQTTSYLHAGRLRWRLPLGLTKREPIEQYILHSRQLLTFTTESWGGDFTRAWEGGTHPLSSTHYIPDNFLRSWGEAEVEGFFRSEKENPFERCTLHFRHILTSTRESWHEGFTWAWESEPIEQYTVHSRQLLTSTGESWAGGFTRTWEGGNPLNNTHYIFQTISYVHDERLKWRLPLGLTKREPIEQYTLYSRQLLTSTRERCGGGFTTAWERGNTLNSTHYLPNDFLRLR